MNGIGCEETKTTLEYRHTQLGRVLLLLVIPLLVLILLPAWLTGSLLLIQLIVLLILVVMLILFCALTVEIKNASLVCSFGPGLIRKTIPLSHIEKVLVVRNPWYSGWGIRWMPGQYWLWNVSGLHAVELIQKNGKRFRVGTDEPEALAQAIQANMSVVT